MTTLFASNSAFIATIVVGAFVFEKAFDGYMDRLFWSFNKGVRGCAPRALLWAPAAPDPPRARARRRAEALRGHCCGQAAACRWQRAGMIRAKALRQRRFAYRTYVCVRTTADRACRTAPARPSTAPVGRCRPCGRHHCSRRPAGPARIGLRRAAPRQLALSHCAPTPHRRLQRVVSAGGRGAAVAGLAAPHCIRHPATPPSRRNALGARDGDDRDRDHRDVSCCCAHGGHGGLAGDGRRAAGAVVLRRRR